MKKAIELLFITLCICVCNAENIKVEYFKPATLPCDDIRYNISTSTNSTIKKKYWILPTGKRIDQNSEAPVLLGQIEQWKISASPNFTITLNKVDDIDFGYYYCIVVYDNYSILAIQQGLNIDGADFSSLIEQYKHNAMIGGIAAAVLFGTIAGLCIVWNFRFSKKKGASSKDTSEVNGYGAQSYHDNQAAEMEEITTELKDGQNNLYPDPNELKTEKL